MTDQQLRHPDDGFEPAPVSRYSSWHTNVSELTDPGSPLDGSMQASMNLNEESMKILNDASQKQLRWDRAMCNELGLPQGYRRVLVLLIKWKNGEDQLHSEKEVRTFHCICLESISWDIRLHFRFL
jgi:hypothetical protein